MKPCLLISAAGRDLWLKALTSGLDELGRTLRIVDASQIRRTRCGEYDLVVLDEAVTNDLNSTILKIRARDPQARIVVFSSLGDWRRAREAMLAGAVDYVLKSMDPGEIVRTLKRDLLPRVPPLSGALVVSGGE